MKKMLKKLSRKIRRSNDHRHVAHFEKLESRELMSFSAHINFQPSGASTPSGYVADIGSTYGSRNGLTYGWNTSNSSNTRDRNSSRSKDQRYDTLAIMPSTRTWGIAVPNGTYSVHIVSGDASYTDSVYKISAEGSTVVSGTPTSTNHWIEGTKTVTVSDGKLSIATAGGSNNKIDFIDITQSSTSTTSTSSGTLTIPPAAPTSLALSSPSSTSIKLTWNDNSTRETGYKIYRSTDGSSFSQVATVGASVTSYTNSGLTSGKKYYFKVCAYNSYGNSSYTNTASLTTGSTSTSSGSTSSPSGTSSTGFLKGINIGEGDNTSSKITVLRDTGTEAVRIWMGLTAWSNRWSAANTFANAKAYHNAGYKVTLLTTCTKVPTYSEAKAYFDWAVTQPGLATAVDYWEIGNEPNLSQYFSGSLSQYVKQELKGAYDSLHAHGEKVIGAGLTASRTANQSMKDAGYLNYVDYANIHPYDTSVAGQEQTITDIKAMFSGKPLVATEWNFQLSSSNTSWDDMIKQVYPFIQKNLAMAYYFNYNVISTPAGFAGIINSDGSKHQPFYDAYKSLIA
ncbi:MAG TPA: fibronectin type III domain-containing protein [Tepidisphaeraceae bacterium]|nr:fibronectin type III domain-containing protein [Tepidisphaeraceae bacterium]